MFYVNKARLITQIVLLDVLIYVTYVALRIVK